MIAGHADGSGQLRDEHQSEVGGQRGAGDGVRRRHRATVRPQTSSLRMVRCSQMSFAFCSQWCRFFVQSHKNVFIVRKCFVVSSRKE